MYKKILGMLLCLTVLMGMAGCGGGGEPDNPTTEPTKAPVSTEAASDDEGVPDESPVSTETASDDEGLLDMVGDDLTVVQEADLPGVIAQMTTQPEEYYGKLYQLTGACQNKGEDAYIVPAENEEGLRLNYMTQKYEDGTKITVVGVLNSIDAEGGTEIVFDTVTSQAAE